MSGSLASYTSVAALRRALDTRDVSATELARASLAAAQARGDLNAFVHIDEDLTLAQARHADAMIEAGTAGPLTGIPIALKDVFVTQGWRSTAGSRMLKDYVSPYDATVVARLDGSLQAMPWPGRKSPRFRGRIESKLSRKAWALPRCFMIASPRE